MFFRQLFAQESCTYTYIIASRVGGEALIVDPVKSKLAEYIKLFEELDLQLVFTLETHTHADHVTAASDLVDATGCTFAMGEQTKVDCVSHHLADSDTLDVDGVSLLAMYTPGHTDDSYCYVLEDRVLTGDTLLIRGTGRTDFQNGSAEDQYDSLFERLLKLPEETRVFPAHDYRGWTESSLGEEKRHNPRLQVQSKADYVDLMNALNLPNPELMDVAIPANLLGGRAM